MRDNDYRIIRLIGKGGMGEVYLAYDPVYDRKVALKKIRSDLPSSDVLKQRFLREPRIAGRLVHPGVVPVYFIQEDQDQVYYTMPYIEGHTLKSVFKEVWNKDVLPKSLKDKTSVSALIPIFHSICRTIEYVHSQGVLHRDLKPDNILLGLFGEVVILDWGAAIEKQNCLVEDIDEYIIESFEDRRGASDITIPGKIVGTLDYMAPERLTGLPATELTDIYSLGVILYQMLTLSFPLPQRKKMKASKVYEYILSPEVVAPYREISPVLSKIVMKALEFDPSLRYQSVSELCADISAYLAGLPSYSEEEVLFLSDKSSWMFSEPILLSTYFPNVRSSLSQWYELSVSKCAWFSDVRFHYAIPIHHLKEGIGILFPVNPSQSKWCFLGYGLWLIVIDNQVIFSLTKNGIEIINKTVSIPEGAATVPIFIEKAEAEISFHVGDMFQYSYSGDIPRGGHIGILSCDPEMLSGEIFISKISNTLRVSCLSIPDAFLAEKFYDQALVAYRRIAEAFPGRKEGCEARFRAGMTLLEKALDEDKHVLSGILVSALEEFSGLHNTVLAPLEYLGKSFVYRVVEDFQEEVKCLTLGLKRYSTHQEVVRLKEQVFYRVHETAHKDLQIFPLFLSLFLDVSSEDVSELHCEGFLQLLHKKIDSTFLFDDRSLTFFDIDLIQVLLSYWTRMSTMLMDLVNPSSGRDNAFLSKVLTVLFMNSPQSFSSHIRFLIDKGRLHLNNHLMIFAEWLSIIFDQFDDVQLSIRQVGDDFPDSCVVYIFEILLLLAPLMGKEESMLSLITEIDECIDSPATASLFAKKFVRFHSGSDISFILSCKKIRLFLFLGNYQAAGYLLSSYTEDQLMDDTTDLFFLYGCWLALTEGEDLARIHFFGVGESADYSPKVLLPRMIAEGDRFAFNKLLDGEKRELLGQMLLYYKCLGNDEKYAEIVSQYQDVFW